MRAPTTTLRHVLKQLEQPSLAQPLLLFKCGLDLQRDVGDQLFVCVSVRGSQLILDGLFSNFLDKLIGTVRLATIYISSHEIDTENIQKLNKKLCKYLIVSSAWLLSSRDKEITTNELANCAPSGSRKCTVFGRVFVKPPIIWLAHVCSPPTPITFSIADERMRDHTID